MLMCMASTPLPASSAAIHPSRSRGEIALLWLEALLAVGAYGGAVGLIVGGVDLGEATASLPFGSAVFAGIALGLVNGVLPTVVLIGALRRAHWARVGHLVVGLSLVAWIVVQVLVLGPPLHPLQALYFAWGWIIAALAVRLLQRR
jgi:hypothetical protein